MSEGGMFSASLVPRGASEEKSVIDGATAKVLVLKVSTEAIVDRRFPVVGKLRLIIALPRRSPWFSGGSSTMDGSTEDSSVTVESSSGTVLLSGEDLDLVRPLVGEIGLFLAPLLLSEGTDGVKESPNESVIVMVSSLFRLRRLLRPVSSSS